ncbi:MAG: FAD:protein FMN transferase [Acidobacteriota bacterium]
MRFLHGRRRRAGSPTPVPSSPSSLIRCRPALGTYVKITLHGGKAHRDPVEGGLLEHSQTAFREIHRIEKLMSFHDPDSELSRINRGAHKGPIEVSSEMMEVLSFALDLSRSTDGAFDITVADELVRRGELPDPGHSTEAGVSWRDVSLEGGRVGFQKPLLLDLGGIAKGYAVDRALSVLPKGLAAVVDAGGDLRMSPWRGRRVHLRVPAPRIGGPTLVTTPMRAAAVASSGAHPGDGGATILCPDRRQPAQGPAAVSVFAASCMEADAFTKLARLRPAHPLWDRLAAVPLAVEADGTCRPLGRV